MATKFWNNKCKKFSNKIWKPDIKQKNYIINEEADLGAGKNNHIDFVIYDCDTDIDLNNQFQFLDFEPIPDRSDEKMRRHNRLAGTELTRHKKEVSNHEAIFNALKKEHEANDKYILKKKRKVQKKLLNREYKRYCKEIEKYNEENDEIYQKHLDKFEIIKDKVNDIDANFRNRRYKLKLNQTQKDTIQGWFYDTTCIYNDLVDKFNKVYDHYRKKYDNNYEFVKIMEDNKKFPIDFPKARNKFYHEYDKYADTPTCVRSNVIKDFVANIESNLTCMKDYGKEDFKFKHREFNRNFKYVNIETKDTRKNGIYTSYLGKTPPCESKDKYITDYILDWLDIECDYKIVWQKYTGNYYVHLPVHIFPKLKENRKPIIVMDPGERIFQTGYGMDHCFEVGKKIRYKIRKKLLEIDHIKSQLDSGAYKKKEYGWKKKKKLKKNDKKQDNKVVKVKEPYKPISKRGKVFVDRKLNAPIRKTEVGSVEHTRRYYKNKRRNHKMGIAKRYRQIKNMANELHYKLANYLCKNYDRIMTTNFSSKDVSSKKGNLNDMSKRVLSRLSHYRFRQRLRDKCADWGCLYLQVDEAYTSKTCSNCGNLSTVDKVYNCKSCKSSMLRDMNGAINILIRNRKEILG